jgi:(S)-sulfolactate dehydrogenase
MAHLQQLDYEGVLRLIPATPDFNEPADIVRALQADIQCCHALICRPTRGGRITDDMIAGIQPPFYIATLSKGRDHLQVTERDGLFVISAETDANAPDVAELTIVLAVQLLRPIYDGAKAVARGEFRNEDFRESRRLQGLTWTCIGSGDQVRYLLQRLSTWQLSRFIIWNPRMNPHRFESCIAGIPRELLQPMEQAMKLRISSGPDAPMHVIGTQDLTWALGEGDVVSLHVPLIRTGESPTYHLFNTERLEQMKNDAILINVARGDVVVEADVIEALKRGQLKGYAADVITQVAEDSGAPADSPLWQAHRDNSSIEVASERLNLILTPHIGGQTKEANEAVSTEVITQLLQALQLPPLP